MTSMKILQRAVEMIRDKKHNKAVELVREHFEGNKLDEIQGNIDIEEEQQYFNQYGDSTQTQIFVAKNKSLVALISIADKISCAFAISVWICFKSSSTELNFFSSRKQKRNSNSSSSP